MASELNKPVGVRICKAPSCGLACCRLEGIGLSLVGAGALHKDDLNHAGVVPVQFKALPRAVKPATAPAG